MNHFLEKRDTPLILVVDDELVGRIYISRALESESYAVITAENGQQAVDLAIQYSPDMIVMDVKMPVMDGYDACVLIRESEDRLNVPILMLTGLDDIESVERSFEAGATDFIVKPVNLAIFKQRIRYGLKARESALALYQQELRQVHAHKVAKMGYWDWDLKSNHLFWSAEVYHLLAVGVDEFSDNHLAFRARIHPDDFDHVKFITDKSITSGEVYSVEHRVKRPDHKLQVVHQYAELIKDKDGKVVRMLGIVQDITDRHLAQEKIQHQAYYDALTNLPNRTLFHDRLNHALNLPSRQSLEVAVMIIDLDRFKNINDSLGHDIGDGFLRAVTGSLASAIRNGDTLARLGGDEFALIIEGVTSVEGLNEVAKKLLGALSEVQVVHGNELLSTGSIGIAISSPENCNKEKLIKQADLAMYQAKEKGGNRFEIYNDKMISRAHHSMQIERELRHALENDELVVYYQPKVSVETGEILGMEALVRWQHPEKGLVPPFDFISTAEETGLIIPIGKWVLEEACKQTVQWHQLGFDSLRISVNVSARQFLHSAFVDEVFNVLSESGIPPHLLDLEVTESSTINNLKTTINMLSSFRSKGIKISMDDFGTGFSSLSYLNQLPLDTLKVDRAFIKDINDQGENGELARMIIAMAKSLGLSVVAEGVETEDHLSFLKNNICDEFQGFLISPPVPAAEFETLLIENRQQMNADTSVPILKIVTG